MSEVSKPSSEPADAEIRLVLMIEDDEDYRKLVKVVLQHNPRSRFAFVGVGSLAEATEYLTNDIADVVLLDLDLPDSSGLPTLRTVRELANGTPLIVLTGSEDDAVGLQSMTFGAQDYLVKNRVTHESMVRCICYAIERRKYELSALRSTAIRDFTTTLAHDMQIPLLGATNVFAGLISGQFGPLTAEQEAVLRKLNESNTDQLKLVRRLLEIYKYELGVTTLALNKVDIKSIILNCAHELGATTSDLVPIATTLPESLLAVVGDPDALNSLFRSLLENAVKFSDGSEPVKVNAAVVGSKISIDIYNAGQPLDQEAQQGLFRSFWQGIPGKSYVARTGLGLYLSYRIVSLHHGKIMFRSAPTEGTTVTVMLPASV